MAVGQIVECQSRWDELQKAMGCSLWKERLQFTGPYGECTTVVFVPIGLDTGLTKVHPTWAGTFILDACVFLFPCIHFALIDSDCVPVTFFEFEELWSFACGQTDVDVEMGPATESPTRPWVTVHKRARSVDTGRSEQPSEPPTKLSRSGSG